MKCTIPEISWHNRDPVLSVDIQPKCSENEDFRRLATGGTDSHVLIWHIQLQENGAAVVEFAADLTRHQRAVNVVRFSPSGEFLASGDDESAIIIWKQKSELDCPEFPGITETEGAKETWLSVRVLRGHIDDVYDLSWSPDSRGIISGSVDNEAILWDAQKGTKTASLSDHKGFVQGVAWDPKNQLVATMCSDRKCRVFSVHSKKVVSRMSRTLLPVPEGSPLHGVQLHLYHDDTFKSFFRRLCFSPDGNLLFTPSGFIEEPTADVSCYATYIYTRKNLSRPCAYLPSNTEYTIAVRCCPVLYDLRETLPGTTAMFDLPYRMVIAVAEQKSVVLYDTQQNEPFAVISNIHYTRLTDLAWSSDGRLLIVSSTDGYCSIVSFAKDELGTVYTSKAEVDPNHQFITPRKTAFSNIKEQEAAKSPSVVGPKQVNKPTTAEKKESSQERGSKPSKEDEDSLEVEIIEEVTKSVVATSSTSVKNVLKPAKRIKPVLVRTSNKTNDKTEAKAMSVEGKFDKLSCEVRCDEVQIVSHESSQSRGCEEATRDTTKSTGSIIEEKTKVMEVTEDVGSVTPSTQSCSSKGETTPANKTCSQSKETRSTTVERMDVAEEELVRTVSQDTTRTGPTPLKQSALTGEHIPAPVTPQNNDSKTVSVTTPTPAITPLRKTSQLSPNKTTGVITPTPVTPKAEQRTPRRVGLITISSPKSKKNLLG